jgi:hypothetical protein
MPPAAPGPKLPTTVARTDDAVREFELQEIECEPFGRAVEPTTELIRRGGFPRERVEDRAGPRVGIDLASIGVRLVECERRRHGQTQLGEDVGDFGHEIGSLLE